MSPRAPTNSPPRGRAAPQANFTRAGGESGDLFAGNSLPRRSPAGTRRPAPGLSAARVLCRQLSRQQALPEKQRIVHLICLNLRAILNRPPRGG